MSSLNFDVNASSLNRSFLTLEEKLTKLPEILTAIGVYMKFRTLEGFANEQNPNGTAWAALNPRYVESKRRRGLDPGILKATTKLRDSIGYAIEPDAVTIGTDVAYGIFAQYGTGRTAKREFLGLTENDKNEIITIINRGLGT